MLSSAAERASLPKAISVTRWDTRRLGEPVEALPLTERGSEALLGAVCLDYSPTAGPTK